MHTPMSVCQIKSVPKISQHKQELRQCVGGRARVCVCSANIGWHWIYPILLSSFRRLELSYMQYSNDAGTSRENHKCVCHTAAQHKYLLRTCQFDSSRCLIYLLSKFSLSLCVCMLLVSKFGPRSLSRPFFIRYRVHTATCQSTAYKKTFVRGFEFASVIFFLLLFHCQFANESERFCIDITIDSLTLNIYRYFDWYSANDKQMANKWEHMQYKYMSSADKNRATDKNPSEKIAVLTSHTTFAMWQRFRLNINIRAMSPRYLGGYIYVRKSHHVCAWRCVR